MLHQADAYLAIQFQLGISNKDQKAAHDEMETALLIQGRYGEALENFNWSRAV